ncbi:hypothetical protein [Bacillus mycoides]|uniref:hypothetical protein n=1 Tax=Bacillus mycoides TaxID=1405 RepID=UPI00273ACDAB|nr:hypothetical protein [Bacillus mycoides]
MKSKYNHCQCGKKTFKNGQYQDFTAGYSTNSILQFVRQLSPGTCIVLQYDSQPPTTGIFQGFQNGLVILSDFDCFPGLAHLAVDKINVISLENAITV